MKTKITVPGPSIEIGDLDIQELINHGEDVYDLGGYVGNAIEVPGGLLVFLPCVSIKDAQS